MYRRRGMSAATDCLTLGNWLTNSSCWGHSIPYWQQMATPGQSAPGSAPPPAPTGAVLTVPPASGAEAQQTVDTLLNAQMASQQAVTGGQVQPVSDLSSIFNQFTGGLFAGGAPSSGFSVPWWVWAVGGGILVFALAGRR
jgi:hypothetical protein